MLIPPSKGLCCDQGGFLSDWNDGAIFAQSDQEVISLNAIVKEMNLGNKNNHL